MLVVNGKTNVIRPFQGVAGKELDMTYLPLAGLRRSDIVCTDLVQCRYMRGDSDVKPPESLTKTCATNHIYEEISTVCPSTIILCGAAACDFFGISKLEFEHGYPRQYEIHEPIYWSGTLVPLYHPAAGLHESKFAIHATRRLRTTRRLFARRLGAADRFN